MRTWNELLAEFQAIADPKAREAWMSNKTFAALQEVGKIRGETAPRNVIFYASAFLQKPGAPFGGIAWDDINALMAMVSGMDCTRGLVLILHTPGGSVDAAESVVSYLRSKFEYIETIVPTFAMSAGTMISLSTQCIVMGKQSQLGPIDPQLLRSGTSFSATAVTEIFKRATTEILGNAALAMVWAPILQSLGPSLLIDAQQALNNGQRMVADWLATGMFSGEPGGDQLALDVASFFNDANTHLSHGRRIDITAARGVGVHCEALEDNQQLQDSVLTAYHLMMIALSSSPAVKALVSNERHSWFRNLMPPAQASPPPTP